MALAAHHCCVASATAAVAVTASKVQQLACDAALALVNAATDHSREKLESGARMSFKGVKAALTWCAHLTLQRICCNSLMDEVSLSMPASVADV